MAAQDQVRVSLRPGAHHTVGLARSQLGSRKPFLPDQVCFSKDHGRTTTDSEPPDSDWIQLGNRDRDRDRPSDP